MNWGLKSILATIIVVIVAIVLDQGLNTTTQHNKDASQDTTTQLPGLDFGTGSMFDSIADRYDTINRVLALRMDIGWRSVMTNDIKNILLQIKKDDEQEGSSSSSSSEEDGDGNQGWKILDIATGTADVALQLIDDLSTSSTSTNTQDYDVTVLGLDPSENMLAVGRKKINKRGLEKQIVLERADARDLSNYYTNSNHPSQSFDAATIAFGIRNVVPNRDLALCEIYKLIKPNGVLAILEFSQPSYDSNGILGAAAGVFIQHVVPFIGGILSGGARQEYIHLQNSIKEFPSPEQFNNQLQNLECSLLNNDIREDIYVGYYNMQPVKNMNFGSVQLYIGRTAMKPKKDNTKSKSKLQKDDPKLPPIGGM
jgi:demethylmenaquinone methyltransferase/2-methoxy-6-polyprenyl-1,4-benzoquinol methylase